MPFAKEFPIPYRLFKHSTRSNANSSSTLLFHDPNLTTVLGSDVLLHSLSKSRCYILAVSAKQNLWVVQCLHPDKEHGSTAMSVHGIGELLVWYMLEKPLDYKSQSVNSYTN